MRRILLPWVMLFVCALLLSASAFAKEEKSQDGQKDHVILLNISGAADKETMARLRKYAEKELRVKTDIVLRKMDEDLTFKKCAKKIAKKSNSPITIGFYSAPASEEHICILTNQQVAVVNTAKLKSDDKEKYERRLERMLMRSAGTLAGLEFDPDPHCVMHSYKKIEDLDRMGRNFSPPWQDRFLRSVKQMDMEIVPVKTPILKKQGR